MAKSFTEKLIRRRTILRGKAVNFRVDRVRLPNGRSALREYVDHPGAVAVIALLPGGKVVLVRQYRYPIGKSTLEIPAGKLDPGESKTACVRRELAEETGYAAGRIRRLMTFWPAPAFSNEALHIYIADRLTAGKMHPDEDEFIEPVIVPISRVLCWISSGKIKDAKTIIGLQAWALKNRR